MPVAIVSSAFLGVRKDRPDEYYLRPLKDFCREVARSGGPRITVASSDPDLRIDGADVIRRSISDLVMQFWPEENWVSIYKGLIAKNPTHHRSAQAKCEQLIGVYLSKLPLMREAVRSGAEAVLWTDAGHWVSSGCGGDLSRYQGIPVEISPSLSEGLLGLARRHRVIGCSFRVSCPYFHMPIEWMNGYDGQTLACWNAPFCLVHRDEMDTFFKSVSESWIQLIREGKAGTEENALTISAWKNKWTAMSLPAWLSALQGLF